MTDRLTLPNRRAAESFGLHFRNIDCRVTIGFYPDGSPGEVFISGGKIGADFEAAARDAAIILSLALQFGTPLHVIAAALTKNSDGSPGSLVGAVVAELIAARAELGGP